MDRMELIMPCLERIKVVTKKKKKELSIGHYELWPLLDGDLNGGKK